MLQQEKTYREHLEFMPLSLQFIFLSNCNRSDRFYDNNSGSFSDFIDNAFTWSETTEGGDFWQNLSNCKTLEDLQNALQVISDKTFADHFKSLNEVQKAFYIEYARINPLGAEFKQRVGDFKKFINEIVWDTTPMGRRYWSMLANGLKSGESAEYVAEIEREWSKEVETISGEVIPKYKALPLSETIYGKDKYLASEDKALCIEAVLPNFNIERILVIDSVNVYHSKAEIKAYSKDCIGALNLHEFEGVYYLNKEVMRKHNISEVKSREGIYKLERIKPDIHILALKRISSEYIRLEDKPAGLVFINAHNREIPIYCSIENTEVYYCLAKQSYFHQDYSSRLNLIFCNSEGVRENLIINSEYSLAFNYKGQDINPNYLQNEEGVFVHYFSETSARFSGLTISCCPHCESNVSNFHDFEACARRNFKNDRYGYHSQKPKFVDSDAIFKIGVEIEKESFEGALHPAPKIYDSFGWVKERDGSLDGHIGYELVSPAYPLFSDHIIKEAEAIENTFPQLINGAISHACGGHIHFSKSGTNGGDLLQAYCGYLPLLYAIYKGRTKISFSQAKEKDEIKGSGEKYQAVRVLRDRIEFRIFPAVKNLKSLKWRINLLRYMAKNPSENPLKVVNDLCDKRTSLHKLFLEIFSEQTIYKRALDTLLMAQKYDRNFYNIDFSKQAKGIQAKANKSTKKK
jgi:hypothetical protein